MTCLVQRILGAWPARASALAVASAPQALRARALPGLPALTSCRPTLAAVRRGPVGPTVRHSASGAGWATNELEEKLWAAAHNSHPTSRDDFLKFLRKSNVIVPGYGGPAAGAAGPDGDGDTRVVMVGDDEGNQWLPAFTSPRLYEAWVGDAPAGKNISETTLQFEFLLGLLVVGMKEGRHGLMLNPGSDCGVGFSHEELTALRDSPREDVVMIESGTQVMVGELEVYPRDLAEALRGCFEGLPEVRAAYLLGISYPGSAARVGTLVAIDVPHAAAFLAIRDAVRTTIAGVEHIPNRPVDFAPLEDLAGAFTGVFANATPFYTKATS